MRELDPGGPGAGRGTGRKHAAAVGIAALCLLAFTTLLSLYRESNSAMELADPQTESAGEYAGSTQKLYQIGNQEYLSMNTGSVEDIADEVQKKLGKELIMLKKIEKAANKGKRVFIKIEAGQIGKRGGPGPQGDEGPTGFQGPRGPRGWRGPQGPRGDTGPIGIKGPKGEDGDDGEHGDTGDSGPVGPAGPPGRRGREGRRGPEGSLGKNGDPGPPGKEGPSGKRGAAGADGARGPKGPPGPPGTPGRAGDEGAPGDKGAMGATGQQGSQGKPGAAGPPGDAGTSVCGINTQLGKQMCCGKVEPNDIEADSDFNHFATVNMAQCKFTGQPVVFTSVTCNSQCWFISSTANIMTESNVMSAKDFKLYLRTPIGVSLGEVKSMQWTIQWCAFGESTAAPKPQQVCCGSSAPSSWTNFNNRGIYTDVNAAGCEFKTNPMFFTSITDKACGSELMGSGRCTAKGIGANSIYSTSQSGFRVYTQPVPGDPVDYQESTARANGWQINWCGVAKLDPSAAPSGKAGYPCTSPRLLKGSNAQEVFSNTGEICCDTTSAAGWKQAGAMAISKEVDISACGFEVVSYTLLNVRGDNPLQMTSGASSWAPTSDATKITVYLQTNGKYKFYNAEQYYWKVQYCMFGK